jgi:hypothetical protein
MSKSHPLKLKDNLGNLQRISSAEKNWLAYQAGLQINEDNVGDLTLSSTGNRLIGSFVDTYYNQAVGTHPASLITSSQTTTNLYQNDDAALENDSDFRLPLAFSNDDGNVYEMNSTNYTTLIDEINGIIHENDYPSAFKLDSSGFSHSDWSVHISDIFTDTINIGDVKSYSIFKRTSMSEPTRILNDSGSNSNLATIVRGDSAMDFDGIASMTDRQMKYSLGQRASTRRGHENSPGTYQLRSATQGPPTDNGIWIPKGSATNTRREVSNNAYTRTRVSSYSDNYTRNYTRDDIENYTRNFAGNYVGNYSRNFAGNYVGDYIGNYSRIFTGNYSRTFAGNYIGDYSRTRNSSYSRTSTRNFVGDYLGNYLGNYTRQFLGNYLTNTRYSTYTRTSAISYTRSSVVYYTRDSVLVRTSSYAGNYAGNFVGNYSRDFVGNYAGAYSRISTRVRVSSYITNSLLYRYSTYTRLEVDYLRQAYPPDVWMSGYTGGYSGRNGTGHVYTGTYVGAQQREYFGTYTRAPFYLQSFSGTYSRFGYLSSNPTLITPSSTEAYWEISGPYEPGAPTIFDQALIVQSGTYLPIFEIYGDAGTTTQTIINTGDAIDVIPYQNVFYNPTYGLPGEILVKRSNLFYTFIANGREYIRYTFQWAGDYGPASSAPKLYYVGGGEFRYTGNYLGPVANYTVGFVGRETYTGNFTSTRVYIGPTGSFTRTLGFSGSTNHESTFVRGYVGNVPLTQYYIQISTRILEGAEISYLGATGYLGTVDGQYIATFARTFVGNYSRAFFGDYTGNYTGEYSRTRSSAYSRTSTRTSLRTSTSDFTGNFTGNYSRGFTGNYSRGFTGNYSRAFIQVSTRYRISTYSSTSTRTSLRTRVSSYVGNYSRSFIGNYAGEYTRTRTSSYTRDRVSTYTRNSTVDYTRTRTSTYSRTSTRTRVSNYAGNYIGNYTGDYVGNYTRGFIGNYIGDTIQSATETAETYTLYVRIA